MNIHITKVVGPQRSTIENEVSTHFPIRKVIINLITKKGNGQFGAGDDLAFWS